ncbi:Hypothetical predicted protein [Mytilus galloprovincialis]|uniref:Uncharacterized protein n=1 Tax=Mytilus galloprovincialis TaxID=29158 RepID=A0A8B6CG34_MYTGA|nr:Hypothetical predicted protein [Mytilus galloprovincialis]
MQKVELWFINQTDLKTIEGQEGETLDIICSSEPDQYITELKLESNGTVKAIGDNQSVSFSFIPDRTDHRRKFQCVDSNHSSIMVEVELTIKHAPAVTIRMDQLNVIAMEFHQYIVCIGPPVFSPENRNVKHGEVGISISMSFYIYSYPAVDEVNIEKIGQKQNKFEKLTNYNTLKSTLLSTEFDNTIGIEGYEILIDSEVLEKEDFHAYLIIVKNHLGESKYRFEIIDQDHLPLSNRKMTYFMIICSIATVIFVYMTILHICLCIKLKKTRSQRHAHEHEDHTYHTYDEIGTLSYRAARTTQWSETSESAGQNAVHQHAAHISNETNALSTDNSTAELDADFIVGELLQSEVTDVQRQRQHVTTSSDDTNLPNTEFFQIPPTVISSMDTIVNCNKSNANAETLSDQTSQSCSDSDSDISNNVMIGNRGDGYENPYQTVLQTRLESHRYVEIANERHTSISSTDSNKSEEQILQTGSTKEAVYINLQF